MLELTDASLSIVDDVVVLVGEFKFKVKKIKEYEFDKLGAQVMAVLLKTKMEKIMEKVKKGDLHPNFGYDIVDSLQLELDKCEEITNA